MCSGDSFTPVPQDSPCHGDGKGPKLLWGVGHSCGVWMSSEFWHAVWHSTT